MPKLIPVQYRNLRYPSDIKPTVGEIPLGFKISKSNLKERVEEMKGKGIEYFSLHTQEPYTTDKRVKNSIDKNPSSIVVKDNLVNIRGSPTDLWSSEKWLDEFITFLGRVSESFEQEDVAKDRIRVIELHPPKLPLQRVESSIEKWNFFLVALTNFCSRVSDVFPKAEYVVENLSDNKSKSLLQDEGSINLLSEWIDNIGKDNDNFTLGIALDIPQLLKANGLRNINAKGKEIEDLFKSLEKSEHNIRSIHLWGARGGNQDGSGYAHRGDLITLFDHRDRATAVSDDTRRKAEELKQSLLKGVSKILSVRKDGKEKYFVPELNFGSEEQLNVDLKSIVNDLMGAGIQFVDPE